MGQRTVTVLALIAGSFTAALPAHAADITPTTLADNETNGCGVGQCTLREAVDKANQTPGTIDRILLKPGATYTLKEPNPSISIDSPVTVVGRGATVQAGPGWDDRIFKTGLANVVFNAVTIRLGNMSTGDPDESGGGIRAFGPVTLVNSIVEDNKAEGEGGGISVHEDGSLIVRNSRIQDNEALVSRGGGIYAEGNLTVSGSTIARNASPLNSGGGIFTTEEDFSIVGSTFVGNTAVNEGGAIASVPTAAASASIVRTTFSDNTAGQNGGAIATDPELTTLITNSRFVRNSAAAGGAIFPTGDVEIDRTTFDDNDATSLGGAIGAAGGSLVLRDTTVSNNVANGDSSANGGGLALFGTGSTVVSNSTLSGNKAEDNGGAIFAAGNVGIFNSTITNNTANFESSDSDGSGGGITATGGFESVTVQGSIVAKNFDGGTGPDFDDCAGGGAIGSGGGNVFGPQDPGCPIGNPADTTAALVLGPLANNGGPTQTHAVPANSVARDQNDDGATCDGDDQRGAPRPALGTNCDSGAYELVFCFGLTVNVVGTDGPDRVSGTGGADGVLAKLGNDTVSSGNGNDRVCGGGGNDVLNGGGGNDKLFGEAGRDRCIGGPGTDTFATCETTQQ